MEASGGVPVPPVPDFKSERPDLKDINPELDNLISQRAAQVVQQAPQMQQIAAITAAKDVCEGSKIAKPSVIMLARTS